MNDTGPAPSHAPTSDFVKTHCVICAGGQTVTWVGGRQGTFCLVLREWTTDDEGQGRITDCDRFEAKDSAEA